MYPHHRVKTDYWQADIQSKEYARPEQKQDTQNRSIQEWVKPEKDFQFEIDVINLSNVELGALLWLLTLPPYLFHRLGGG